MKILFVASSGGHWEELMCLKEIAESNNSIFVTEAGTQINEQDDKEIITLSKIDRKEKGFLFHFIKLFYVATKIVKKEKPDVVITTGALLAFPFCVIAKMKRKKIIYIESFARLKTASLTGRLVYPMADLFIVQWEDMLIRYPKAKYGGTIFS